MDKTFEENGSYGPLLCDKCGYLLNGIDVGCELYTVCPECGYTDTYTTVKDFNNVSIDVDESQPDKTMQQLISELCELQITKMKNEMRDADLRRIILPYVKERGQVKLAIGIISYREYDNKRFPSRCKLLETIRSKLGNKIAEKIDDECAIENHYENIAVTIDSKEKIKAGVVA